MNLSSSTSRRTIPQTFALAIALAIGCAADDSGDDAASETGASSSEGSSTAADSSTGDPPRPSLIEQCDAPSPCTPIARDPGSGSEGVDDRLECALEQALAAIDDGTALELRWSFCDIGCWGTDLLLVGDGTAYIQTSETAAETDFGEVERCTLQPASVFEACLGQPWTTSDCANARSWVTDCEPVDDPQCP